VAKDTKARTKQIFVTMVVNEQPFDAQTCVGKRKYRNEKLGFSNARSGLPVYTKIHNITKIEQRLKK